MTEQEAIKMLDKLLLRGEEKEIRVDAEEMDLALNMSIKALEKQIPQPVTNQQGIPLWGYCPSCGETVTKSSSPVGCKWCLQRVEWEGEKEDDA